MSGSSCECCGKVLVVLCRFMGLSTALGLWGVGVEAVFYKHVLGFYLLPLAVILSFLETVFLLNYCVQVCASPTGVCTCLWRGILWLDDWRKGILFLLLAGPCFLTPTAVPLALACGVMLAVTGMLYCVKTYETRKANVEEFLAKTTYDRFDEEMQEDLEDDISNPTSNVNVMSVVDQIEILDV